MVATRKQPKPNTATPKRGDTKPRRRASSDERELEGMQFFTSEEWYAMFDAEARRRLGMRGDEFKGKWNAGEFEDPDTPDIIETYLLMPRR